MNTYQKIVFVISLFTVSVFTYADDNRSFVINKVIQAYGGDNLVNVKNLTIEEIYKSAMIGQSETPETLNLRRVTQTSTLDFAGNSAEVRQKIAQREIDFYFRKIYKNGLSYNINLVSNSYAEPLAANRFQVTGYTMLLNDIGLARLLVENKANIIHHKNAKFANVYFEHLELKLANDSNIQLYVDKRTWLIKHSFRQHRTFGQIRSDFFQHQQSSGLTYANETEVFYGKALALVTLKRKILVNQELPEDFAQTKMHHQHSPHLYSKDMIVRSIAKNTYLVGKGAVHSIFYIDGDNVYGAESYAGVMARFNALEEYLSKKLTLKSLVVTHHHSDHISGINELAESDTNIITVKEHLPVLQESIKSTLPVSRFTLIEQSANFANGKIQVFDIATAHSSHNLVFYVPSEQLLFVADHYRASYLDEKIIGFTDLVNFRNAIDNLPIKIKTFASVHGINLLDYKTLIEATDNNQVFNCQKYASLCD